MISQQRLHPLKMVQLLFSTVRNSALFIIYLFVLRANETSFILKYGRLLFIGYMIFQTIFIISKWLTTTYEIKDKQIHFYQGLFKKRHNRLSITSIQNIQQTTPFYFKPFQVTSLQLLTSATDKRGSVSFTAIPLKQAERIESIVHQLKAQSVGEDGFESQDQKEKLGPESSAALDATWEIAEGRTLAQVGAKNKRSIVFQPSRQELYRASFLSLSFLLVIPVAITFFENMKDFIAFEKYITPILQVLRSSWLFIGLAIIGIVILFVGLGFAWTFYHYGKYEIATDKDRIFVQMGLFNERSLSIRKENVQALQIVQTPIKKWLNVCEVKLISAESMSEEEGLKISSLFPFMQVQRAFSIVHDLLPSFSLQEQMRRLPRKALWMKWLRVPWLAVVALIYFLFFQPSFWFVTLIIALIVYFSRFFDYRNTRFGLMDEHLQLKHGGLWSTMYLSSREKIIEIYVTRSYFQQKLDLATITVVNRASPVRHEALQDVPYAFAKEVLAWYGKRGKQISEETDEE